MKLIIPNFCFMNTKSKKNLLGKTFPYVDLKSPYLSIVEYGPQVLNILTSLIIIVENEGYLYLVQM